MLLEGFTAAWFQGVKSSILTWNNTIDLLRTTFVRKKSPSRVNRELVWAEQDSKTRTDIFICKCRSSLALFPTGILAEISQIDTVYGLLHAQKREKVPRDQLTTFCNLLNKALLAEETFSYSKNFDIN